MHLHILLPMLLIVSIVYLLVSVAGYNMRTCEWDQRIVKQWKLHLIYSSFAFFVTLLIAILFA